MVRTAREVLRYESASGCVSLVDMPRSEDDAQPVTVAALDLGGGDTIYLASATANMLGQALIDAADEAGNRNVARVRDLRESFGG